MKEISHSKCMPFGERALNTIKEVYFKKSSEKEVDELCKSLEAKKGKFDTAIIVLMCDLNRVITPQENTYIKTDIFSHMREIAAAAKYAELVKAGHKPVIIISGGKVHGQGEDVPISSNIMKQDLMRRKGIPPEAIIIEPFSIDTSQNARFSSKMLKALGFGEDEKEVSLITNDYHMDRSQDLFERYYDGKLNTVDAETVLENFEGAHEKKPFEKFMEAYRESDLYRKVKKTDDLTRKIVRLPGGEKIVESLGYYARSVSPREMKIKNPRKLEGQE